MRPTDRIGCQRCGEDKPTIVYEGRSQQADLCGECADRVNEILGAMGEWRDTVTGGESAWR